jgi:hypothetical protein
VDTEKKADAAAKDQGEHMASPSDIDTSDDSDCAEEDYQLWMRREAARIRREESMRDPAAARLAAEQRAAAAASGAAGRAVCSQHHRSYKCAALRAHSYTRETRECMHIMHDYDTSHGQSSMCTASQYLEIRFKHHRSHE